MTRTATASTVLAYDAILNLPDELEYIWGSTWSVGKVLYVAGRYPVLALFLFNEVYTLGDWGFYPFVVFFVLNKRSELTCHSSIVVVNVRTWISWIPSFPLQITLSLRTLAIWGGDRKAAVVLGVAAATYNISVLVSYILLTIQLPNVQTIPERQGGLMKLGFGTLMFYDGVMFILILMKIVQGGRETRAKILTILFRDGVIYYAVILALNAANLMVATSSTAFDFTLVGPLVPTLLVAQSIGASHIILNLRKHAYASQALPSIQLSSIRYQERRTIMDEFRFSEPTAPDDIDLTEFERDQ
ncbi:hypothetical protein BD410DRAFT_278208 [Rickenella mellea]|uniref:DUF6533 domain-containing protein n=1 Tax=Rickenella mellea TaxID=50990 RepID=A0A4Y7PFP2_9AGAM|nr:hypothetical protein BD410DRAFT_278208 [Rickenella mellea]